MEPTSTASPLSLSLYLYSPVSRRFLYRHRHFPFSSSLRHVVDFYVSNFQSGLRAFVKTGYGARVTPYVDDSIVIDVNLANKDMSPEFFRWLEKRKLSSDNRIMQLK
ncbi:putative membrane protein [Arachis hypogaea]|nr:putative membrane protein [Arachis hypogaea]